MNGYQVIGPVGIYEGGDGRIHVRIEDAEGLEQMIREVYGPHVEIVFEAPQKGLDARLASVEEELDLLKRYMSEEKK